MQWMKKLFVEMVPIVAFFFVAFSLVDIAAILKFHSLSDMSYSFMVIFISSCVMAKVVLLSDLLPFVHRFSTKPLIYNTVWKSFIYTLCSVVVRFLERFIPASIADDSLRVAFDHVMPSFTHVIFWVSQIWLCVLLMIFVASRELVNAVGSEKIRKLFFGYGRSSFFMTPVSSFSLANS